MNVSENDKLQMATMMLNHANAIAIHSGNILNWYTLKKGLNPKSSEELHDALTSTITAWTDSIGTELITIQEPLSTLDIHHKELMHNFDKQDREGIKITVKLFLSHWRSATIKESVKKVCDSLGVSKLNALIVSFPVTSFGGFDEDGSSAQTNVDLHRVKPIWREMEALVKEGVIDVIGVTDFDGTSLEELHSWATVKPSINQICMANCCDLPADILQFAEQHDIELLSHNDPPEMMSEKSMHGILDAVPEASSHGWSPSYAIRYSVVVKCRGIVEAKGYIVGAERHSEVDVKESGFF